MTIRNKLSDHKEILVISHKYPPSIGGMQKQCFELVEGLSEKLVVHRLIQTEGISKLWFFLTATRRAKKMLREHPGISLIYVNDGLMAFVLSKLINKVNVPLIATIHGLDVVFPMQFYQRWVRSRLSLYDGIIAVSKATSEQCIQRGIPAEKVYMVKNGHEPFEATPMDLVPIQETLKATFGFDPQGKKIIISIGRGVPRKGFSWFIKNVFTRLPENTVYLIIGPGANTRQMRWIKKLLPKRLYKNLTLFAGMATDEMAIEDTVNSLGLGDRVKRISGLSNVELKAMIQLADISVMPNLEVEGDFEGFGLVALEAASNGTLCIASGIEGIATAIEDKVNGILLESGNDDQWVTTLNQLLNDPSELSARSEEYQKNTSEASFSWEKMVEGYYRVFSEIMNRREANAG